MPCDSIHDRIYPSVGAVFDRPIAGAYISYLRFPLSDMPVILRASDARPYGYAPPYKLTADRFRYVGSLFVGDDACDIPRMTDVAIIENAG